MRGVKLDYDGKRRLLRKALSDLEFRDIPSSAVLCVSAFLTSNGRCHSFEGLLDSVPIPFPGPAPRELRRLGIRACVDFKAIQQGAGGADFEVGGWYIALRRSGYAALLFVEPGDRISCGMPGHPKILEQLAACEAADAFENIFRISLMSKAPSPVRRYGRLKFSLMRAEPEYVGVYDPDAVSRVNKDLIRIGIVAREPRPLREMSYESLLASHASISERPSKYLGALRRVNLRRGVVFVDWRAVPSALRQFFRAVNEYSGGDELAALTRFGAQLFNDFLLIHPFINANRRMAMALLDRFMLEHGYQVEWRQISICEIYYWVRCAGNGHLAPLTRGLAAHARVLGRNTSHLMQQTGSGALQPS